MRFNPNLRKNLGIGICGNMRKLSHNKGVWTINKLAWLRLQIHSESVRVTGSESTWWPSGWTLRSPHTWQAGIPELNWHLYGKIIEPNITVNQVFHCNVWLPEGNMVPVSSLQTGSCLPWTVLSDCASLTADPSSMRPSMLWFQSCSELPWTPKGCSHTPLSRLYSTMFHDSILIVACMLLLVGHIPWISLNVKFTGLLAKYIYIFVP